MADKKLTPETYGEFIKTLSWDEVDKLFEEIVFDRLRRRREEKAALLEKYGPRA